MFQSSKKSYPICQSGNGVTHVDESFDFYKVLILGSNVDPLHGEVTSGNIKEAKELSFRHKCLDKAGFRTPILQISLSLTHKKAYNRGKVQPCKHTTPKVFWSFFYEFKLLCF